MKKIKKVLGKIADVTGRVFTTISDDHIAAYSAQASFFTMISAFPFIMLLLSVLGYILPAYSDLLDEMMPGFIPAAVYEFITGVLGEIVERSSLFTLSLSAVLLFWSGSRGIYNMSIGMRNVYAENRRKSNYIKANIRAIVFTVVFMIAIVLILLIMVLGQNIGDFIVSKIAAAAYITRIVLSLRGGVFLIFLTAVFTAMYKVLSDSAKPVRAHFPGAVFAAIGWLVFSWAFSVYIKYFSNFSVIYGSLTSMIVLMLWLYSCMFILFLGVELNKWLWKTDK